MASKPDRQLHEKDLHHVRFGSLHRCLHGLQEEGRHCAGTINGMMDRMMQDGMKSAGDKMTPRRMKKAGEEMMKKMSEPMIKTCTDDKWSAEALKCMDEAKDEASGKKCEAMLTPDQTRTWRSRCRRPWAWAAWTTRWASTHEWARWSGRQRHGLGGRWRAQARRLRRWRAPVGRLRPRLRRRPPGRVQRLQGRDGQLASCDRCRRRRMTR